MLPRCCLLLTLLIAPPLLAQGTAPHEGVAQPFKTVTLSASLREVITHISVEEGQRMKEGEVVVSLESEKEKLAVERLEQMLEKARFDALAAKRLFDANVSSKDDMLAKEVELKRVTAELNIAKAELVERSITAPISGVVVHRLKEVGEAVNEADPILQVMDADRLLVLFHLETPLLTQVKMGDAAEVTFSEVQPQVVKKGKIHFIDPQVDARSGLFRVRVLVDNQDGAARPGMKALWTVK